MTGPEHYSKAEQLLDMVGDLAHGDVRGAELIAEAHVHATLAQAAATALLGPVAAGYYDEQPDLVAWADTAGAKVDGS